MRAGRLDRLVTIQRSTRIMSADGHPTDSWSTLGEARRPASVAPVRGEERFTAPQYVASEQVEFRVHYADSVADLSPLDRIVYPAFTDAEVASSPQPDALVRRVYDVLAVHEVGRREGLQIIAARRPDVQT